METCDCVTLIQSNSLSRLCTCGVDLLHALWVTLTCSVPLRPFGNHRAGEC